MEFPSVAQLPRILREEGISPSAAEQAFGSKLRSTKRMRRNPADETVRVGFISRGDIEATEYTGPETNHHGQIYLVGPGSARYLTFSELGQINSAAKLFSPEGLLKAFGHMAKVEALAPKKKVGERPASFRVPGKAKKRKRYKLGHVVFRLAEGGGVMVGVPGVKKHSLVLIDATSGNKIEWGAAVLSGQLKNVKTNREISLTSIFDQAAKLGIHANAVLTAFGDLIPRNERSELLARISGTEWKRGKPPPSKPAPQQGKGKGSGAEDEDVIWVGGEVEEEDDLMPNRRRRASLMWLRRP